jgi:hypothetical protein
MFGWRASLRLENWQRSAALERRPSHAVPKEGQAMHFRAASYAVLACFLAAYMAAANAASNLIVNPDFDHSVSGWTVENPGNSSLIWISSQSAVGASGSGSGLLTAPVNAGNWNADGTCISMDFAAGSQWDIGGWVRIPSGQTGSGTSGFGVVFYATTDCSLSMPPVLGDFVHAQVFVDVWNFYTKHEVLPAAAHSAQVYLNIDQSTNNLSYASYFDGMTLSDDIFEDTFE